MCMSHGHLATKDGRGFLEVSLLFVDATHSCPRIGTACSRYRALCVGRTKQHSFLSGHFNNIASFLAFKIIATSRFRDATTNGTTYAPVVAIHGKHLQGEHCGWGAVDLELSGGCDNCIAGSPPNGRVLCQQA